MSSGRLGGERRRSAFLAWALGDLHGFAVQVIFLGNRLICRRLFIGGSISARGQWKNRKYLLNRTLLFPFKQRIGRPPYSLIIR
jgi:hypothetical protein